MKTLRETMIRQNPMFRGPREELAFMWEDFQMNLELIDAWRESIKDRPANRGIIGCLNEADKHIEKAAFAIAAAAMIQTGKNP
jgi:hypothetical protein